MAGVQLHCSKDHFCKRNASFFALFACLATLLFGCTHIAALSMDFSLYFGRHVSSVHVKGSRPYNDLIPGVRPLHPPRLHPFHQRPPFQGPRLPPAQQPDLCDGLWPP